MAHDPFGSVTENLISPARSAFAITPDDDAGLSRATRAVFVGTGGNLNLRLIDASEDVVFANVPDGSVLALRIVAVRATGTTAADIIGLV